MVPYTDARDYGVSLRLTAEALRLGEFTVRELSDAAGANLETARDFVTRRKEAGVFVSADQDRITASNQRAANPLSGRPPLRYRVSDNHREKTQRRLNEIHGKLASATGVAVGDAKLVGIDE